ncbi:MAG: Gfo/Idh/MocA family oxidoreductase [Gemmatimonadetes bacterium]|nr:Gfo/Idh/MocA family oxidoreductase [Gemmatimonadota bacterium]
MKPVHIAFLGCGFITKVHSSHLRALRSQVVCSYASRDPARSSDFARRYGNGRHYAGYDDAIADPAVDAVVVAVPPRWHLDLTLRALEAGKHVLVEKPAFPRLEDYRTVIAARDKASRVVIVGENDHYKPLAVRLRRLLSEGTIGELVLAHFITVADRPKPPGDWRNDEALSAGDAFFEEGIHWLHFAGSLGPRIQDVHAYRPPGPARPRPSGDRRRSSMLVSFQYDNGAAGALYYSREIPSLLRGLRLSKLFGRAGVATFESNGAFLVVRGRGMPRLTFPGFRDIRGYRAMYRDFVRSIRSGGSPEMSVERAEEDHRLMERIQRSAEGSTE